MLTLCPECGLQISDKAIACPHCGYPLQPEVRKVIKRSSNKRRRLPNGFGQISEIKGRNLRNPFRAMITVGKKSTGEPICRLLKPQAYFATYNEAYEALIEYNRDPYDLSLVMTIQELYEQWGREYYSRLKSQSHTQAMKLAWKYCYPAYEVTVRELRPHHIKACMEDSLLVENGLEKPPSAYTKSKIKTLFNLMLDYAVEYDLVDRNVSKAFSMPNEVSKEVQTVKRHHKSFTDDEISLLWSSHSRFLYADMLLIQCYSGWRPQELIDLKVADININDWTFTGGLKTEAGKNRTVPIHSKIRDLVLARYHQAKSMNFKYLFIYWNGKQKEPIKFDYPRYKFQFDKIVSELFADSDHRPHDCRKHFVTMAKKYQVDEYAIKYLVGHAITDLTERVYTDRDISWLQSEIEKIR